MRVQRKILLLAVLLLPGVPVAYLQGHPESASYSDITVEETQILYRLRIPMEELDLILMLDTDLNLQVDAQEIEGQREEITLYIREHVLISSGGQSLEMEVGTLQGWLDTDDEPYLEAQLVFRAPQPIQEYQLQFRIFQEVFPAHYSLATISAGTQSQQAILKGGEPFRGGGQELPSLASTIGQFLILGMEHIFVGYDHILFLLGLLLVAQRLLPVIKIVTSFTVAHSLTLALAGLHLVNPSARLVESGIALSIAYIGFENLFMKRFDKRWRVTFIFGLIHGFGFANVLEEMDLTTSRLISSLFSFNLGVELGQVIIVSLLYPFLLLLYRLRYHRQIVQLGSVVVLFFGLMWLYQRALF